MSSEQQLTAPSILSEEGFGDPYRIVIAHIADLPTTSISIDTQLPEFVRQDHPKFVNFIKAYYDWLDAKGGVTHDIKRLKTYADVDTAIEQFDEALHREFLVNIPRTMLAHKPTVLKHIRQFYRAKGTEKSFKFFFRALYNSPAEFYYPRQDILKLSDGKYIKEKSIRIFLLSGEANQIDNNLVVGQNTGTTAYVDRSCVFHTEFGTYYELFLNVSSITGNFDQNEVVQIKRVSDHVLLGTGRVLPVISKIEFVKSNTTDKEQRGLGYEIGDSFVVEDSTGKKGSIKVVSVDASGAIKKLLPKEFGFNYKNLQLQLNLDSSTAQRQPKFSLSSTAFGITLNIEESAATLTISKFNSKKEELKSMLTQGSSLKVVSQLGELLYTITDVFDLNEKIIVYLYPRESNPDLSSPSEFQSKLLSIDGVVGAGCVVKVTMGSLCEYPGYYISNNGQLSETKYLHDGEFYQQFSYLVYSKESSQTYLTYLKDLVHPLGLKFFAGFRDPNELDASVKTKPQQIIQKFQQYPRKHLFPNVPVPDFMLIKNNSLGSAIQIENVDYTILPRGDEAPYNKDYFSIRLFSATTSDDEYVLLFRDQENRAIIRPLSTQAAQTVIVLPSYIPLRRYEDQLLPHKMDVKYPQIKQNVSFKSPALDAIKRPRPVKRIQCVLRRDDRGRPRGASLRSIYRERFRYHPTEHMTSTLDQFLNGNYVTSNGKVSNGINVVESLRAANPNGSFPNYQKIVAEYVPSTDVNNTYWNLNTTFPQYANTQIRHFKHMIPKSLEAGDVPEMLIIKNGNILATNAVDGVDDVSDYLIIGKSNTLNKGNGHYCIELRIPPIANDIYEVIFRDATSKKIVTKTLHHVVNDSIIEIPYHVSTMHPNMRINIMPDVVVSRGIEVKLAP